MPKAVILMGSNIEVELNLAAAVDALHASQFVRVEATTSAVEYAAVDKQGQYIRTAAPYRNMAALISTALDPISLRSELRDIERRLGRVRPADRYGEVIIDLDIAVYDDWVWSQDGLEIPDPAIALYPYAAQPIAEAAPDWIHPVIGKTYAEIAIEVIEKSNSTRR